MNFPSWLALTAALTVVACQTAAEKPPALAAPLAISPPFLRTFATAETRPTVLLVPGCETPLISGRAAVFERYATRLRDEGFATAIVDYPSASTGSPKCREEATPHVIADAIDRALAQLATMPGFDGKRIHLIGWSQGAAGVLHVIRREKRRHGLVSAAVFYPRCPKPAPWKSEVTLFMLLGEKDVYAPASSCREWADESEGPGPVVINRYVGVGHGFDVGEAADPAYASYRRDDVPLAFDASTDHQATIDLLKFLKLALPAGA